MRVLRGLCAVWLLGTASLSGETIPGRYLVELLDEPAIAAVKGEGARLSSTARAAAIASRRAAVVASQLPVRRRMEARGARVRHSVDTVANVLVVETDSLSEADLAAIDGVRRVQPVERLRLSLDRAVAVHKAPAARREPDGTPDGLGGFRLLDEGSPAGAGMKIAVLDTGIDTSHPGLQDGALLMPEGFPKVDQETFRQFTNSKVIVARAYETLTPSPQDRFGHGTGVAMAAAGRLINGPWGPMSGAAPRAWLGNYRVNEEDSGAIPTDFVLRAMDDAIRDGMDVLNFSFGSLGLTRPGDDILAAGVTRATQTGIVVVMAAGNDGPSLATMQGTADMPEVLAVGASENDRRVTTPVLQVQDGPRLDIEPGSNSIVAGPVTAALADVTQQDSTSLACNPLPGGSLAGKVALILRGVCDFETKINNAAAAGAAAALIHTDAARPNRVVMSMGAATLPSAMISHTDGNRLKELMAAGTVTVTLGFWGVPQDINQLARFSSRGPAVDASIKPDLTAIGSNLLTAGQMNNPAGELYSRSGFLIIGGTSFSAPLVAGAAAVLKAVRPGLKPAEYRSLLVNSARPMRQPDGRIIPVQQGGAGLLDIEAALGSTAAAAPVSTSFGISTGTVEATREISLTNLAATPQTFTLEIETADPVQPALSAPSVSVDPGGAGRFTLAWNASGLAAGEYQGYVLIRGPASPVETRIPYWLGVRSTVPANIVVARSPQSGTPESNQQILFRVIDAAGIPLTEPTPSVTVVSGGGTVTGVGPSSPRFPNVWTATVRLSVEPGNNVFRIEAGAVSRTVTIRSAARTQAQ